MLKADGVGTVRFCINLLIYINKIRIRGFVSFHVSAMGVEGMQGLNIRTKKIKR